MDNKRDEPMQDIEGVLERPAAITVPEDFAARVMARVPAQRRRRIVMTSLPARSHVGNGVTLAVIALLIVAMVVLAPLSRGSYLWSTVEGALLAQLGALVLLLGYLRRESR